MSAYPLVIEGVGLTALVVGGGSIGTRKALALLRAGAMVHVVSREITEALADAAGDHTGLRITRAAYVPDLMGDELLIIAATDDPSTNAAIAADARARGRLVNVVSAPHLGNCATPAVHRAGEVVIAVSAGGVPNAAVRIRDALGRTIDTRYAKAVADLATLRRVLLDDGHRERWNQAMNALVSADFCRQVESGELDGRIAEWR